MKQVSLIFKQKSFDLCQLKEEDKHHFIQPIVTCGEPLNFSFGKSAHLLIVNIFNHI